MEGVRTVGRALVIAIVLLRRLGRRKLAGSGAGLGEDEQLTAGQLGFQRLTVPGPSNEIIVLQVAALDAPRLTFVHSRRPRIRHFNERRKREVRIAKSETGTECGSISSYPLSN